MEVGKIADVAFVKARAGDVDRAVGDLISSFCEVRRFSVPHEVFQMHLNDAVSTKRKGEAEVMKKLTSGIRFNM